MPDNHTSKPFTRHQIQLLSSADGMLPPPAHFKLDTHIPARHTTTTISNQQNGGDQASVRSMSSGSLMAHSLSEMAASAVKLRETMSSRMSRISESSSTVQDSTGSTESRCAVEANRYEKNEFIIFKIIISRYIYETKNEKIF